jgi:hypothetical protein
LALARDLLVCAARRFRRADVLLDVRRRTTKPPGVGTDIRSASSSASLVRREQPAEAVEADDRADGGDRLTAGERRA